MERFDLNDKGARPLTRTELGHIDATLLLPALNRCPVGKFESGQYVIRKYGENPNEVRDGVDYFPQFYSKVDSRANTWEYFVGVGAMENFTFDELSLFERERMKKAYRKQYFAEGGEISDLSDDDEWQALVRPEEFENVSIYIQTIAGYVFGNRVATRKYEVTRDAAIGRDAKTRQFGSLGISIALGDWTLRKKDHLSRRKDYWSHTDATTLDMAAEDYSHITFKEVNEAVAILQALELVTPGDHARFARGIRL